MILYSSSPTCTLHMKLCVLKKLYISNLEDTGVYLCSATVYNRKKGKII